MRGDELLLQAVAAGQGREVAAGKNEPIVRPQEELSVDTPERAEPGNQGVLERGAGRGGLTGLVQKVEQERAKDHEGHILSLPQLTALEANLVASVLAFQTARRPFRSAFEPLSQITGQKRPRVRIAGKGDETRPRAVRTRKAGLPDLLKTIF